VHAAAASRAMLSDEISSLRISGSPVHRRVSKPNLADFNPSLVTLARCVMFCMSVKPGCLDSTLFQTQHNAAQSCSFYAIRTTDSYRHNAKAAWNCCDRKYAWDWLAILLLMVVLVVTEELKPFERSIYHETDQVTLAALFTATRGLQSNS